MELSDYMYVDPEGNLCAAADTLYGKYYCYVIGMCEYKEKVIPLW